MSMLQRHFDQPLQLILRIILIPSITFLFTTILPGIIALRNDVFFEDKIKNHMPKTARASLAEFESLQSRRKAALHAADKAIAEATIRGAPPPPNLLLARNSIAAQIQSTPPPLVIFPFTQSNQMLLWPSHYSCLLWLAVILAPAPQLSFWKTLLNWKTFMLAVTCYVFFHWSHWLRNVPPFRDEGRKTYFATNFDVDAASFIYQEIMIFCGFVILSVIWRQWSQYLLIVRYDDPRGSDLNDYYRVLTDPAAAASFADVFWRWVCCSVILGLGFSAFTVVFWNIVVRVHDQRYLLSALMVHLIWGITWIIISLPLINEWQLWDRCRTYAAQALATMKDSEEASHKAALLREIQPVASTTFVTANAVSVISFLLPIAQVFVK